MKRIQKHVTINYKMDTARHGAPYTMDNIHYFNHGELTEFIVKACLGYDAIKESNGRYDEIDDIADIHASVKSNRATLTSVQLGTSFDEIVNAYFKTAPTKTWIYAILDDDVCTMYIMNQSEFKAFLYRFGYYCKYRNVVRLKTDSKKMRLYLNIRARC